MNIVKYGKWAAAIAAILGLFSVIGFNIEWPNPAAADIENLEIRLDQVAEGLTTAIEGQKTQNATVKALNRQVLENSLFQWEMSKERAEDALKKDPNDATAKEAYRRADRAIRRIETQLGIGQ